mmetsp:Transcript_24252/g.46072  ORF Transcript_24252/g.46072 Transcript_24252/m.46072 type:complete len:233 (+) Transcript_24252:329-1027(+)
MRLLLGVLHFPTVRVSISMIPRQRQAAASHVLGPWREHGRAPAPCFSTRSGSRRALLVVLLPLCSVVRRRSAHQIRGDVSSGFLLRSLPLQLRRLLVHDPVRPHVLEAHQHALAVGEALHPRAQHGEAHEVEEASLLLPVGRAVVLVATHHGGNFQAQRALVVALDVELLLQALHPNQVLLDGHGDVPDVRALESHVHEAAARRGGHVRVHLHWHLLRKLSQHLKVLRHVGG